MQRLFLTLAVALLVSACSRAPDHAAPGPRGHVTCWTATILREVDGVSLLEIDGDTEPKQRGHRSGSFGSVGERFQLCE